MILSFIRNINKFEIPSITKSWVTVNEKNQFCTNLLVVLKHKIRGYFLPKPSIYRLCIITNNGKEDKIEPNIVTVLHNIYYAYYI